MKPAQHNSLPHPVRWLRLALAVAVLLPGLSFSADLTMPGWFWQQSSAGFLGPNLVVNTVISSGYRVFCWQVGAAITGIAMKADLPVGDVQVSDLIPVRPVYCQMILKATRG